MSKKWDYFYAFLRYYERFQADNLNECLKEGDETQIRSEHSSLETVQYLRLVMEMFSKMTDEEADSWYEEFREWLG